MLSRIHIYIYYNMYVYIYIYISVCVCACVSSKKKCFRIVSSQPHEFPTVTHDSSQFDIVAAKLHPSWMGTMDASRRAQDSSRVEKTSGTERWVNRQKKEEQLEEHGIWQKNHFIASFQKIEK